MASHGHSWKVMSKYTALICVTTKFSSSENVIHIFKVTHESYAGSFPTA